MRLFVALPLPPDLARLIIEGAAQLREALPEARWVREENLHITLAFLGEQSDRDAALIGARLEAALAGAAKIPVRAGKLACFTHAQDASVLALRITEGQREARELAARTARALFLPVTNAFTPHITLARRARTALVHEAAIEASGTLGTVALFKSDLCRTGPVYTPLALFLLA